MIVTVEMVVGTIAVVAIAAAILGLGIWIMVAGPGEESPSGIAAAKLGLTWKMDLLRGGSFEGRLGRATVRVRDWQGRRRSRSAIDGLRIDVPLSPRSGILFRSKKVATSVLSLSPDEVVTGDPAFDAAVFLTGTNEAVVLAAADADTRAELLAAADSLAAACDGALLAGFVRSPSGAEEAARALVSLAGRLAPRSTPDALAANALHDPVAGVRLRNLVCLRDQFTEWARTGEVLLEIAQNDPDAAVRLEAARSLDAGSASASLVAVALDESAPAEERAGALRDALRSLSLEEARPVVVRCIDMRAPALCLAALRYCGEVGFRPSDSRKTRLIAAESWERPIKAAALRLLDAADPESEELLYEALKSGDVDERVAAATALGETGTVAAVEHLLTLTEGALTAGVVREAAALAIEHIQERAGGAAGQLAIAENDEAGRLSPAPDRRGAVTAVPKPRKR